MTVNQAFGQQSLQSPASEYNALVFLVSQILNKLATVMLVQVKGVTNAGELDPVGFVDVQPLVNQMTGDQIAVPHGVIYGLPYFRLQGGTNAIIIDPEVGDIGMCGFCSRDISAVIAAKGIANPGSFRTFDWSDGLYFGGFLNGTPEQYIKFGPRGMTISSPSKITIQAPSIDVNASTEVHITSPIVLADASTSFTVNSPVIMLNGATTIAGTLAQTGGGSATMSGSLDVTGDVTAEGTSVHTHEHDVAGIQTGSSTVPTTPPL